MISITGEVELRLNGKVKYKGPNLVTTLGKNLAASVFKDTVDTVRVTYGAVGDGLTTPTAADTALDNEIAQAWVRQAVVPTSTANNTKFTVQWAVTTTETIREGGLFTLAVAGTMVARFLTPEFEVNNGDVLDLTWTLNFGGDET